MKLLFDQNLAPRLVQRLADLYPESVHIQQVHLTQAADSEIWEYAKKHHLVIVSKDSDFQQRSLLFGHPPKFVWLRVGNCPVAAVEELLRRYSVALHTFEQDAAAAHLMLP